MLGKELNHTIGRSDMFGSLKNSVLKDACQDFLLIFKILYYQRVIFPRWLLRKTVLT